MDFAYVIVKNSHAETAIKTGRDNPGKRYKVQVENSEPPHDTVVVDAWWTSEGGLEFLFYEDGRSGKVVQLGPSAAADALLR